jgi:hypothetical protein
MNSQKSKLAFQTTNTATNNLIKLFTIILTPALFGVLLGIWNIDIRDFESVIHSTDNLLPSILSGLDLTHEASEALTFAWLVVNKGMIEDCFPTSVKNFHTEQYKAAHKLLSDNIKKIRKTMPKTLSDINALSLMRDLWDTVSRFHAFNSSGCRAIIKRVDNFKHHAKIRTNKRGNENDSTIIAKTKYNKNPNYLEEETDDEDIAQRKFDSMFEDEYERDYFFEVIVPENARRAAEMAYFDNFTDDDDYSSDEDLDEWKTDFDNFDYASLKYTI